MENGTAAHIRAALVEAAISITFLIVLPPLLLAPRTATTNNVRRQEPIMRAIK